MHVMLNTHWIEKIFLHNGRITCLAFQLMQPKLCAYSKMKTHYDTLEISPQSTQDEIKSSYYKLTKLYHPDKNKSELAKRKFQNISEAYEVLSNHQARKRYDRSMIVKQNVETNTATATYTHTSIYKSKTHPKRTIQFNFDLWAQKHYGEAFARSKSNRMMYTKMKRYENFYEVETHSSFFWATILILSYVFVFGIMSNYDVPIQKETLQKIQKEK